MKAQKTGFQIGQVRDPPDVIIGGTYGGGTRENVPCRSCFWDDPAFTYGLLLVHRPLIVKIGVRH